MRLSRRYKSGSRLGAIRLQSSICLPYRLLNHASEYRNRRLVQSPGFNQFVLFASIPVCRRVPGHASWWLLVLIPSPLSEHPSLNPNLCLLVDPKYSLTSFVPRDFSCLDTAIPTMSEFIWYLFSWSSLVKSCGPW